MSDLCRLPVIASHAVDVLVVGAGSAGCCAAIAARQGGADKVLLVERHGFPGGSSTQMLDTFYGFFTPGERPHKVVGGLPDAVVNALDARGAVFLRPNTYGAGTGVNYNPEVLKSVWDDMLHDAGVTTLLHATVIGAECSSDRRITRVIVWSKAGLLAVTANRYIDASGDADLCHHAGLPYERAGEIDPAQTLTTTFRMCNVDLETYERAGGKKLLQARMAEAVEKGTHALPRKSGSFHEMNVKGCVSTVAVRVSVPDAANPWHLTEAEREGRRQSFVYENFMRECVPGFRDAQIIGLSHQIGVRETRRVYGAYRLTKTDCLSAAKFDDRVLLCGAPIEDHRASPGPGEPETEWGYVPGGETYDVPYRTLVPRDATNLWVVGRCFSATHDAHASCRSMAQTMAMGMAAGTAAALSISTKTDALSVSMQTLQHILRSRGAVLEMPAKTVCTKRDGWSANLLG